MHAPPWSPDLSGVREGRPLVPVDATMASRSDRMCRSIRILFNFAPPATDEEIRAASLQFVRKVSGFTRPSRANQAAFDLAVDQVSGAARVLLDSLVTASPPRDRALEAARSRRLHAATTARRSGGTAPPGPSSAAATQGAPMPRHRIFTTSFASVYPLYVQKAERKGRTKAEVDRVICWLTGYTEEGLRHQLQQGSDLETFFAQAPALNPDRSLVRGTVCGVRVEEIADPLMQLIRYLDKLVDELARGKAMESILRRPDASTRPGEVPASPPPAADWRDERLATVRALIHDAVPGVTEEIKWRKPSNPQGVPVWSHHGILCTGETYRQTVKLTFARGAALPDPSHLFNSGLDGKVRRAIDLRQGDTLDEGAFKELVSAAAALNERDHG